jgi:2-keto-4-pentenoate hydratase/2-oxohepta-3-ene-1,7-dioic acid hydratase in catechol pathway
MKQDRRSFLKISALVGAATMTGAAPAAIPATVQAQAAREPRELPKNFTFCTLRRDTGYGLGVRTDRGILDVVAAEADFREGAPTSITAVLNGQGDVAGLRRLITRASDRHFIAESAAKFGPCVTEPEKIVCIGQNYRRHVAEMNRDVPKVPVLFNKFNTALNHHNGTIAVSKEDANNFDYEAELVIVLGRVARNVKEADVPNYVFGYCNGNDFTARELQTRTSQWMVGKSLDGSGVLGPWLVTADQVDDGNLKIECRVNEELRQSANTSELIFNCKQLVSYISKYTTLKPGDIIFTGTPDGVIAGYPKDKQVWLKPGDKIVTSIEKLGDLHFTLT